MPTSVTDLQAQLADREAIRDCLMRYCRGIDRMDAELVLGVYWPDAVDEHLVFTGSPAEFVAWCMPLMQQMEQTVHLLGNILIAVEGAVADVESYFQAFHRLRAADGKPARDLFLGGRYLDRFERRNDEWRIARRTTIADWFREHADSGDWSSGPLGMQMVPGTRAPHDPSCRIPGLNSTRPGSGD
jgi:ketosteroid isomerase-like protein